MILKNKKAVSGVITTIIMIALVLAVTAVLWISINSLVNKEIDSTQSCFGNFGKINLNEKYTCRNPSGNNSNEIEFGLSVGDITIDGILVSISGESATKGFEIKDGESIAGIKMFNGTTTLNLPDSNSGLTYIVDLTTIGIVDASSIRIAPIIGGNQCDVSDSITSIGSC